MPGHVTSNRMSAHKERGDDLYETPDCATLALLNAERLPYRIWEPACGPGAIVKVLRKQGHHVLASNLIDYECPDSISGIDFLMEYQAPAGIQAIVTNPPYMFATEFIVKALTLVDRVYMFLRLEYLQGMGRPPGYERSCVLDSRMLTRIYVLRDRIPMMHRQGYEGKKQETSRIPFAWFVWDRNYDGPAVMRLITARPDKKRKTPKKKITPANNTSSNALQLDLQYSL